MRSEKMDEESVEYSDYLAEIDGLLREAAPFGLPCLKIMDFDKFKGCDKYDAQGFFAPF